MTVRLGAVGYLNARPLVYGLENDPRFQVRYDIPSECSRLLHAHEIDLGLVPTIEYLRGRKPSYIFVPGPAVTSRGRVRSVAIYTRRDPRDIRTMAMDTSSRTSVALSTIIMRRMFDVSLTAVPMVPDLDAMLAAADAALIIGDNALFLDATPEIQKIDLGEAWFTMTGLPFVYAFWAGWPRAAMPENVKALQLARDAGVRDSDRIAETYYRDDPSRQAVARQYLRDNIRYYLGHEELEGLQAFFRYADELNLAEYDGHLRFYHAEHHGADRQG